ncbi:hypothetical protein [Paraliomyxa miuraensis]|uniref:hypothetical protein n=1 Tax=Paraliomyxa miuraensis TaxID=376150 RepID=UPI002254AAC4|nr:hypothetical protein [Paraliomyxa miuraensis]MCX4239614.1 hypothetical protein [Paraliomyxa miuraensis]
MRQFLLGLSFSVAFVLGCMTAQHVPSLGVPTATAAHAGPRWEYTCTTWPSTGLNAEKNVQSLEQHLDQLGAEGWELASISTGGAAFLCFKRPG